MLHYLQPTGLSFGMGPFRGTHGRLAAGTASASALLPIQEHQLFRERQLRSTTWLQHLLRGRFQACAGFDMELVPIGEMAFGSNMPRPARLLTSGYG
jgi:hypothetical protein